MCGLLQGTWLQSMDRWAMVSNMHYHRCMPWIEQVSIAEATGELKRQFEAAIRRAGRVWHIVHIMSLNPRAMRSSMQFYLTIMMGVSPLSRVQREILATVTSAELECFY